MITYTLTYDEVTPESAEEGDFSDSGWIVDGCDVSTVDAPTGTPAYRAWCDEQGVREIPFEVNTEEGETTVDAVVSYLRSEGYTEASEEWTHAAPRWWTKDDSDGWSGTERRVSIHFKGLTEEERREVYRRMRNRA